MSEEIKYIPKEQKIGKPNIIVKNGWVVLCTYCGEQIGNTQKFCSSCKTKKGREDILKENVEILGGLRAKGYCKEPVELISA